MSAGNTNHEGGRAAPRSFLGLRVSAIVETFAFLAVALIVDHALGTGDRFSGISPHPFWIIVLLVSTYYGTNEGLSAAGLCAIALLLGNVPEQGFNEERTAWLLRITFDPVLWILAALLLGEISSGRRRKNHELANSIAESQKQIAAVTEAYDALSEAKASLEVRVAAQRQTVPSVYQASRSIDQQTVAGVLNGVTDFVRAVIAPKKFSLFLLNGNELVVEAQDRWQREDSFLKTISSSSPLFEAVVLRRESLFITDPAHEAALSGQGVIAGPVVNAQTGQVVGMLKIEDVDFGGLHPSTAQNCKILCEWIGAAYANAWSIENARRSPGPLRQLLPGSLYDSQRSGLTELAREAQFDACALYASFEIESGTTLPNDASVASSVLQAAMEMLSPDKLAFNFGKAGWTYAILLAGSDSQAADDTAQGFTRHVCKLLAQEGCMVRSRYLVEILHQDLNGHDILFGARADG